MKELEKYSLKNYSDDELLSFLLKEIKNSNEDLSVFAIREQKHYSSAKVCETLTYIMENDSNQRKKIAAINSLKKRKPNSYTQGLLVNQLFNENGEVRATAAEVLHEYKDFVLDELHSYLTADILDISKTTIIKLLGYIGNTETLEILMKNRSQMSNELQELADITISNLKKKNVKLMLEELEKEKEKCD